MLPFERTACGDVFGGIQGGTIFPVKPFFKFIPTTKSVPAGHYDRVVGLNHFALRFVVSSDDLYSTAMWEGVKRFVKSPSRFRCLEYYTSL